MSENIRGNFLTPTVWWRFVRETRVYWCSDLVRHFERSVAVFAASEIVPLWVCISWIATVSLRLRSWLRDTSRTLCASYSPIMKLVCSISWWDFWPAPCRVLELRSLNRYDARPSRSVRKLARSYGAHHFFVCTNGFRFLLRHNLSTYGRRAFAVAGPAAWNSLSDDLRDPALSADSFRRLFQTRLFSECKYIQRIYLDGKNVAHGL